MTETPKYQNTFTFHQPVGNLNAGDTKIEGDQVGIQHNYAPEQDLTEAAAEIQQLLAQLATAPEAQRQSAIVQAVEAKIQTNPTLRERLWSAFKAGGIEALKQALDAICKNPVASISVEAIKGFLEAECEESM